jgi:hypothetical protein
VRLARLDAHHIDAHFNGHFGGHRGGPLLTSGLGQRDGQPIEFVSTGTNIRVHRLATTECTLAEIESGEMVRIEEAPNGRDP